MPKLTVCTRLSESTQYDLQQLALKDSRTVSDMARLLLEHAVRQEMRRKVKQLKRLAGRTQEGIRG